LFKPKPLPAVAAGRIQCQMVRRGSSVRVRQRALQKPCSRGFSFRIDLDEQTDQLVDRLRDAVVPAATTSGDAVAYISGQTAAFKDVADQIFERMPLFLLYIIGVTLILLAMAFRSIVISATAAITTLLFRPRRLRRPHARRPGRPPDRAHRSRPDRADRDLRPTDRLRDPLRALDRLMIFVTSRIREERVHGLNTRDAVEHGVSAIGRVVVAAAVIMGTVFAAFLLSADRIPRSSGSCSQSQSSPTP